MNSRSPQPSATAARPWRGARLGALSLAALLVASCGSAGDGAEPTTEATTAETTTAEATADGPVSGGTYVHALEGSQSCLDGPQQMNHWNLNIIRQLTDSLVDQDPETGEIVPWLAESWEVTDDATSFTFHLVDGATFADGAAIDAEAVKANLDRVVELGALASGASAWVAGLRETTVVDELTVTVAFEQPNAQFLQALSGAWLGLISPADIAAKSPEELCAGEYAGSGPFTLDSQVENQEVVLTRRDGYAWPSSLAQHQGAAYLDTLVFTVAPEASVRAGLLTSGQAQSISATAWQDESVLEAAGAELLTAHQPGITDTWIVNQESWLAEEEAVRQAIQHAIDSQEIIDTVYGPTYRSRSSLINRTTPGWIDLSDELAFDPDEAVRLLEADGWVLGDDGVRVRDGQRLSINVIAVTTSLEVIQQQLAAVGIEYTIRQLDNASYGEARRAGDYDLVSWTMTRGDPTVLAAAFSSDHGPMAYANARPSELDDLLAAQESTVDSAARAEAAAAVQRHIVENAWAIPIVDRAWTYGVGQDSRGLRLDGETRLVFYDAWVGE